jgi:glutaminase
MSDLKAVEQQFREQYKVAENTAQNALYAWLDLAVATTEWGFNTAEQNLRYALELRGQVDRAVQEALTTYRSVYQNGLHSWRDYARNVNGTISHVTE